jgi:retron-type reverse transcriptase
MPVDTAKYPHPTRILSKKALRAAWRASRDASNKPGARGIDDISARQFKSNIEQNISRIHSNIKSGDYHFSKLRPFLFPKKNGKYRVVCVPTVCDRLVQRAIVQYIAKYDLLRLLNKVSYGFVSGKDKGVQSAIAEAIKLRTRHEWVLKTDIQSFFDEIHRPELKARIMHLLGSHSMVPLLCAVVDSEVRVKSKDQERELIALGIRPGRGLRQGMPLSPILSNLVLAGFDHACGRSNKKILRYADDLILFGDSKAEVEDGFQFLATELGKVKHTLPLPGSPKTEYVPPKMGVEFLGLEIVHRETVGRYVCRIPKTSRKKILSDIADKSALNKSIENKMNFGDACRRLGGLPSAYRSAFRQAEDWDGFEPEVRQACNKALRKLFIDIFGVSAVSALSMEYQIFLGINSIPDE